MEPSARPMRSRRPSYLPHYGLDELFDNDELALKLKIAQYRILTAFDRATYFAHGKVRSTDNFIIGVGERQKDLVEHVVDTVITGMKRGIVCASELPTWLGDNSPILRSAARNAERQIVAVQLAMLSPRNIWFEYQAPGFWVVAPSLMDEYRLDRELVAEAKKIDTRLRREGLHGDGRLRVVH